MTTLQIKLVLVLVAVAFLAGGGWYVKSVFDERAQLRQEVKDLQATRKAEQDLQRAANKQEQDYIARISDESRRKDEQLEKLDKSLARSNHALAGCRIDNDTLSVLNDIDQGAKPAAAPAGPRPGPAPVEASPTCEDLAVSFEENKAVYRQTAAQVQALRNFYKDVRTKYCAATGAC